MEQDVLALMKLAYSRYFFLLDFFIIPWTANACSLLITRLVIFMFMSEALIIFVRKPELGKVKTRLAAQIGNEKALSIYKKLLEHTKVVAKKAACDTFVFCTETWEDHFWEGFYTGQQEGNDLGEKMQNAFSTLFKKKYKHVVIIGSDCPSLSANIIAEAFNALHNCNIVVGPAEDGGYYLLGMNALYPDIFRNKAWSTDLVFEQTINDVKALQLSYKVLPVLNDVDELKDVPAEWL